MTTDHILSQINTSLNKMQGDITDIKVINAQLNSHLNFISQEMASEKSKTNNNASAIIAHKEVFSEALRDVIMIMHKNHQESKDYTNDCIDEIKKKIDELQGRHVKFASILGGISAGVGAGTAYLATKFPVLSKLFD